MVGEGRLSCSAEAWNDSGLGCRPSSPVRFEHSANGGCALVHQRFNGAVECGGSCRWSESLMSFECKVHHSHPACFDSDFDLSGAKQQNTTVL